MAAGGLFKGVVDPEGADFVHEAHADLAAHGGVAGAVGAFHFVHDELLHAAAGQDAAGAGEIEGAGVIEAVEEIGADDMGDEVAFFGANVSR